MSRRILFAFAFSFYISNLLSQEIKVGIRTGYGFYNMSSLSPITREVLNNLPFEAKIISDYPPYHYYQPVIKVGFKHFEIGLAYTFQTTGTRISSKDYSGEYKFDTSINGNSLGFIVGSGIRLGQKDSGRFHLGYFLQTGLNFSNFKMNETLQIDTFKNSTNYKFSGNSFYFEPGINLSYLINERIIIEADLTYYKEILRKDYELIGERQRSIQVKKKFGESDMWDGFRLGITLSYVLFK